MPVHTYTHTHTHTHTHTRAEAAATGSDDACKDIRPRWVKNGTEPPAGSRDMGSWKMAVFTEEQQARLGVDEKGDPVPSLTSALDASDLSDRDIETPEPSGGASAGATVEVVPAWVKAGLEPPAGEVDMGGWLQGVYTEEQQARLGVDAYGETPENSAPPSPVKGKRPGPLPEETSPDGKPLLLCGGTDMRPAWMRNGLTEAPAGRKSMGTWEAAVYTSEQQARLGVDESGNLKTPGIFSGGTFSP
jgi:hypothetical protein